MNHTRADIRELLSFARPQSAVIALALGLGVLATLAALAQPLAVGSVIDSVTEMRSVWTPVGVLVALFVADAALSGVQRYLLARSGERVVFDLRRALISRLLRLPVPDHDRRRAGDLISRVNTDTTLLRTALTSSITEALSGALTLVGAVVLMALIDPVLLSVALLCVLVAAGSVLAVSSGVREASEEAQRSVGALGSALDRALRAIRTVKVSRAEGREETTINAQAESAYRAGVRSARLQSIVEPASLVAVQGSFVLVLGIGGARLAAGAIELSDLVSFLLYLLYLVGPLVMVFTSFTDLQRGLAAVDRIKEVLAAPTETEDGPSVPRPPSPTDTKTPAVRFESVRFGYVPGREVLRGVSFEVPALSRTALVGPSGSGKSTIFALLARFYEANSGTIFVEGEDVRRIPLERLRGEIGYVEQESPVMAGSIRQNLLYANPVATDEELREALDLTNLWPFLQGLPRGLDTEVGDAGVLLSGGERQRIAIARTLLARPRLLLLDEITSQLDTRNELALRDAIARVSERCTVMVVAHRLSTVVDADRIVVLDDGRVSDIGTHDELLVSSPLYRELAENQLVSARHEAGAQAGARREDPSSEKV
jgi:ABC-type multidrug transport system fused ATPase/permease subunit